MNPVNYVKVDPLPGPDDMSTLIDAIRRGDFFATTGEVSDPVVLGARDRGQRTVVAEVEWTFPLEFVEVVWGDGQKTDRQIIAATDLPPFGKKRFQIPFNAAGRSGSGSRSGTRPATGRSFNRSGCSNRTEELALRSVWTSSPSPPRRFTPLDSRRRARNRRGARPRPSVDPCDKLEQFGRLQLWYRVLDSRPPCARCVVWMHGEDAGGGAAASRTAGR